MGEGGLRADYTPSQTISPPQVPPPQWHAGTGVKTQPTNLLRNDPRTLKRGTRATQPRACFSNDTLCSSDGLSQLPSEPDIWARQYPLGVWD